MRELRSRGIDASLTVVGCSPPAGSNDPHLCVIPFLDKSVAQDHQRLNELFKCSDFMLFPTRNEAFGVVCCEANAFGLPLIACRRGGVPIWTNENGISLEPEATALAYADAVQSLINDPDRYFQLALSGRRMFDTRLNWDAWGKSMSTIFERVLERRQLLLSRQFLNENHSPPGF
jgi:glycosyltransferase involved in cell wall biosynthesis